MSRWWKGVALVAAWLGLVPMATAQSCCGGLTPSPVGAARMPEPQPCGPTPPAPNLIPGPLSPELAPPGPPDCLSLPANHNGAFQCENYPPEEAIYASLGAQWLQRQRLGKGAIAVVDPQDLDTGIIQPGVHHDIAARFNDVIPTMTGGVRATIGYLCNDQSIELTGFYIFQKTATLDTILRGRLDAFFFNPPLGFEGDNGLWTQADRVTTTLSNLVGNLELNYRRWNVATTGLEVILGLRFFHVEESLGVFTDDDGLTVVDVNGNPDPRRQATYGVDVTNNIIAPQFGVEYNLGVLKWLSVGSSAKAAVGPDFIHVRTSLVRGDGFKGFDTSRNAIRLSSIFDLGAFLDVHLTERLRFRAGYNAIWLVGFATSIDQLDFNLANPTGQKRYDGSTLFHGPMLELQFLF
jgi:hypothetical protein